MAVLSMKSDVVQPGQYQRFLQHFFNPNETDDIPGLYFLSKNQETVLRLVEEPGTRDLLRGITLFNKFQPDVPRRLAVVRAVILSPAGYEDRVSVVVLPVTVSKTLASYLDDRDYDLVSIDHGVPVKITKSGSGKLTRYTVKIGTQPVSVSGVAELPRPLKEIVAEHERRAARQAAKYRATEHGGFDE